MPSPQPQDFVPDLGNSEKQSNKLFRVRKGVCSGCKFAELLELLLHKNQLTHLKLNHSPTSIPDNL